MAYGDNSTAYKLLAQGTTWETISKLAVKYNQYTDVATFADGSFVEWRRGGHHQAFLSSGHNVTPL